MNRTGKNIIVGCIYKHHTISPKDFTKTMKFLLSKLCKEKKTCYLAGDYNMNLLQMESSTDIELYFDELTHTNFTLLITSSTRVTSKTKTLIDNIFFNEFCSNIVSGNLSVGISDHMPQFALIPAKTSNISNPRILEKKYGRKHKNINMDDFNKDLYNIN